MANLLIIEDPWGTKPIKDLFGSESGASVESAEFFHQEKKILEQNRAVSRQTPFFVECASDGEAGILSVRNALEKDEPYSVVIIDMRMKGLDGVQTATRIFTIDPRVQIIFCITCSDDSALEMTRKLAQHRDQFLVIKKNFSRMEWLQATRVLVEKWHQEQALENQNAAPEQARKAVGKACQRTSLLTHFSHELRASSHGIVSYLGFALKEILGLDPDGMTKKSFDQAMENFFCECKGGYNDRLHEKLKERLIKLPEWIYRARVSAHALRCLLDDLLDLSKIEEGRRSFIFQQEDMAELISTEIQQLSCVMLENKIHLLWDLPSHSCLAEVDAGAVMQIVRNLVTHSARFSSEGGTIRVTLEPDSLGGDPAVCIVVMDEGSGIPNDELKAVFNAFEQSTRTNSQQGTGFGLPICYRLVEAHGGLLTVCNHEPCGSIFRVVFPVSNKNNIVKRLY